MKNYNILHQQSVNNSDFLSQQNFSHGNHILLIQIISHLNYIKLLLHKMKMLTSAY